MLSTFRRARSSWLVLLLLGLVMIAFIITGVGTPNSGGLGDLGGSPDRLVTIGKESITATELNQRLNRELDIARQDQPDLDMAGFIRLGGFDAVLRRMISEKAQVDLGNRYGLVASKRMIDGVIAGIPAFQDAGGSFDETRFRGALANIKLTEAQLRDNIRTQLLQRQLLIPVEQGTKLPDTLARQYSQLLLETRSGSFGVVPVQAVGPGPQPTDAEVAEHFKKNQARYLIPERRAVRYALFGRPDVAAAAAATDAEVEAAYRAAAATYGPKETRNIEQLTLADQAGADAFAAKVRAGTSFVQAAADAGFGAGDIVRADGTRTQVAQQLPPAVADAAFAGARGAILGPIRSPLGWHVARLESVTAVPGRPLDAVRGELAAQITERKTVEGLDALAARIEDAIADGASFDEVVRANKLGVTETPPVTVAGAAPGTTYQVPTEATPLLRPAFDLSPDDDPVVETLTAGQRYALLAVTRIVGAEPPPLPQVQARVRADMLRERSVSRAKRVTDQLVAKINAGTPIREAFAQAGVALPAVQAVTMRRMEVKSAGENAPPPLQLMFTLPRGKARQVAAPNGAGWFVVVVDTITPGKLEQAEPLVEATRSEIGGRLASEYAAQFALAAEREIGIKRNDSAIARLKRQLQTGGATE